MSNTYITCWVFCTKMYNYNDDDDDDDSVNCFLRTYNIYR